MQLGAVNEPPCAWVDGGYADDVTRFSLCVLVLLALLVDGCGGEAPRESGAGETAPQPPAAPQTITEADSGESFTLALGSQTRLQLSGKYSWSEPTVRGDAVQLARVDYFQDPGFSEWIVRAVQPGTATIEARGTPACAGQPGCQDAPLSFELEITVTA